jgi:hypothetical protein
MHAPSGQPPHAVTDEAKLARLIESMRANGWQGRPLLAYDDGNGLHYLTGSHRLIAAQRAMLDEIPVLVIDVRNHLLDETGCSICGPGDLSDLPCVRMADACDDDDRRAALKEMGDVDAVALMEQEER